MRDGVSNKLLVTWGSGPAEADVVADWFPECLLSGD